MANATLICVFSDRCGACNNFKQNYYEEFMSKLHKEFPTLNVEIINLPDMNFNSTIARKYHNDLARYVNWFPCFILTNKSYNNKNSSLEAVVFNGVKIGNSYQPDTNRQSPNPPNLINWVKSYIRYSN